MSGISASRRPGGRTRTNLLRAGLAGIAAAGAVTVALAASTASAAPAPAPRFVEGNVTTCEEAGLSGEVLFGSPPDYPSNPTAGSGTVSGDGTTLDVTINEGFTASGIVVKGGPDTNVYDGPFVGPTTVEGMQSPPVGQGNIPEISHWFVCGTETVPTSPPATSPPPTSPAATSPPPTALPLTGTTTSSSTGLLLGSAAAFLGVGALLITFGRKRRGAGA